MTDEPAPRSRRVRSWIGPVILLVTVAGTIAYTLRSGDEPAPDPIDVVATGQTFATVEEMYAAADIVVEGTIVADDVGRTITDPAAPDTGFVTALFQLDVETVFTGDAGSSLTIEQEATLLDGTPIIVNGQRPNQVGDTGYWFLVRGGNDDFPYVAIINEQGRILTDDDPDGDESSEPATFGPDAVVEVLLQLAD